MFIFNHILLIKEMKPYQVTPAKRLPGLRKSNIGSSFHKVVKQKHTVKHLKTNHQLDCQTTCSFCPKCSLSSCSANKKGISLSGLHSPCISNLYTKFLTSICKYAT